MNDHDPTEGFRLLFPGSKRSPLPWSKDQTDHIKRWIAMPDDEGKSKAYWSLIIDLYGTGAFNHVKI